jgi:RimJ/RimL family protein N-acetyltransferase
LRKQILCAHVQNCYFALMSLKQSQIVGLTRRLQIEELQASHAANLADLLAPEVNAYFDPEGLPKTVEDLEKRFARAIAGPGDRYPGETWLNFAVRHVATDSYIGRLEATLQQDFGEVAFLFVSSSWGQGYATEGTQWLMSHCTETYGTKTFWATVSPRNERSLALCKRLGFTEALRDTWPALTSYDDGDVVFSLKR